MIDEIKIKNAVYDYFEEYDINDLMDYGSSDDAAYGAMGDISDVYADIMKNLGYPVKTNWADDYNGDGKYVVWMIITGIEDKICIETKAWRDADGVAEDIQDLVEDIEERKERGR